MRNKPVFIFALIILFLAGCLPGSRESSPIIPWGMTKEEAAALRSLKLVDPHPLYTMQYDGPISIEANQPPGSFKPFNNAWELASPYDTYSSWGCTLFAALGNPDNLIFGRNFDWQPSPALLLFTNPPDGYSSVSMVDISYLGFSGDENLVELPLTEQKAVLRAVELPFDGMNEEGLSVGMAAVPTDEQVYNPDKPSIDSLVVMREILDHARTVDEAVEILDKYNIAWGNGPPLHYLIADRSGNSILAEFYKGKLNLIRNSKPWHLATNFHVTPVQEQPTGYCVRYDRVQKAMIDSGGKLSNQMGLDLLRNVTQSTTQWSVLYGISKKEIQIIMGSGRDSNTLSFHLE